LLDVFVGAPFGILIEIYKMNNLYNSLHSQLQNDFQYNLCANYNLFKQKNDFEHNIYLIF